MSAHPPLGRPLYEPADRIPALADLRAPVHRQDRDAVAAALAAAFAALGDEDDRAASSRVVGEQHNAGPFLNEAMAQDPGDPLVRSLLAGRLIRVGRVGRVARVARVGRVGRDVRSAAPCATPARRRNHGRGAA
ncbi:hypothetical protein [Streptomyces sp. AP-93]|uniref:hypothetical protein n=1 Tax=Streptomyces sp. AP-93 TaxID=2929048 RepID=UPI001FAE7E8A|nr:hypothetical protein [Streptomyces sp. AP-93]MCJ0870134.1 hypothetical protein [Streptomyces sp. AP-93]